MSQLRFCSFAISLQSRDSVLELEKKLKNAEVEAAAEISSQNEPVAAPPPPPPPPPPNQLIK